MNVYYLVYFQTRGGLLVVFTNDDRFTEVRGAFSGRVEQVLANLLHEDRVYVVGVVQQGTILGGEQSWEKTWKTVRKLAILSYLLLIDILFSYSIYFKLNPIKHRAS